MPTSLGPPSPPRCAAISFSTPARSPIPRRWRWPGCASSCSVGADRTASRLAEAPVPPDRSSPAVAVPFPARDHVACVGAPPFRGTPSRMTFRARPVTRRPGRSGWDAGARRTTLINAGFAGAIVISILILVGYAAWNWYDTHFGMAASVDGAVITRDDVRSRLAIETFRI